MDDITLRLPEDLIIYNEILQDYSRLTEENIGLAFAINKKSTAHKDRIGELVAHYNKLQTDAKFTAESIKSRISIDKSPDKPTAGDRIAAKEQEYLDAINKWTSLRKTHEYLEICYKILLDITFQCFNIYIEGNKRA